MKVKLALHSVPFSQTEGTQRRSTMFRFLAKKAEYQHPVFFKARDLTDREKEKIRRYFQKKRDSGGGDCGLVEKVGDNTYRVSFKDKQGMP